MPGWSSRTPADCDALPAEYRGQSVDEIRKLAARLDQISIDSTNWVRIFRCRDCGQLWEEWYEATGHGENANVRKMQMTPYEVISRMSNEIKDLPQRKCREYLWQNVPWLAEMVRRILLQFAEGAFLESATIYVGDPSFRQVQPRSF